MTQSVELAIANLQSKSTSAGCAQAPAYAIEEMGPSPFSLAYEDSGETFIHAVGFADDTAVLVVEHHVSRSMLPKDIAKAATLRDTFIKAIRDDVTLNGTVDTVSFVRRKFGRMKLGTMPTVGYRYEIGVKIQLT